MQNRSKSNVKILFYSNVLDAANFTFVYSSILPQVLDRHTMEETHPIILQYHLS